MPSAICDEFSAGTAAAAAAPWRRLSFTVVALTYRIPSDAMGVEPRGMTRTLPWRVCHGRGLLTDVPLPSHNAVSPHGHHMMARQSTRSSWTSAITDVVYLALCGQRCIEDPRLAKP